MKWDISLEKWTTDSTHEALGAKLGTVEYCLGMKNIRTGFVHLCPLVLCPWESDMTLLIWFPSKIRMI